MQLAIIGDNEKIDVSRFIAANPIDVDPNPAATLVDGGTRYGILRQQGYGHADGINRLSHVLAAWRARPPQDPGNETGQRVHIGDDEKVQLAAAVVPIIQDREPADIAAALVDVGCQFGQVVQLTGDLSRAFRHAGALLAGWYDVENPWPAPPAPPRPAPSAVAVEGNRRWLRNTFGRFDWRETTAFGGAGSIRSAGSAKARLFIETMAAYRFNLFQVLTTLDGGYWHPCRIGPNYSGSFEAIDTWLDLAEAAGAYTRLVIFGGLDNFGGQWDPAARRDEYSGDVRRRAEDWAHEVASRYARRESVIYSLVNEPDQTGFRDSFDKLVTLGAEIKRIAPDRLLCFGGHTREGDTVFLRAPADYNDVHLQRLEINTVQGREFWPTTKRSGENPNIDQRVMPFVHGEPVNYGEAPPAYGRSGRGDIDQSPAASFCAAAVSRARQYNLSFHWDGGLFIDQPLPLTIACIEAYHAGLDAFPMTDGGTLWRGHWAESFFRKDIYPPTDELEDNDDLPDDVEDWVDQGRGPWRVYGVGDRAVTIFEPASFDMARVATAPIETVARVVHGRYASGVYRAVR